MKTKVVLAAVLVSLVMSTGFFSCNRQQSGGITLKSGVLQIGMEIGYPPMEYLAADGSTPIGFDVEMGKAIAAKMGLQAEFIDTAWDGIFAGVNTDKFDCIISSVTINDARLAAHNFSKPYIQNTLAIVLPKGSSRVVRSPQDLAGMGVSYQEETTSDDFMTELAAGGLRFTPYEYDKVMYCFDELRLGRVDAIVTDLLVAYEYVAQANTPFEIVWQGGEEEFGICMKKGNDALTTAINDALDSLFTDGTLLRISNATFGMDLVSAVRK
ncbi:MAG: transporter substrate-binding domain-containing protein [Treponema sp.]|jgi:polar amino acid transport system substrate-binding protein|nr:transporter substrate-binding domain-containing protein [Treponema sp.]